MLADDFVDVVLDQWNLELPGLDFEPMGAFARMARYSRLASRVIYRNINKFDLNETQFNMLAALHRAGEPYRLTPTELSSTMLLTSGTMTYVVDQMEKAGNVVRVSDPHDRRKNQIQLTTDGRIRIEKAIQAHVAVCADLLAPLSPTRRKNLIAALHTLLLSLDEGPMPAGSNRAGKEG